MARFADNVVLVTGAGSGIGEAVARRFASEGARVACADRSGREGEVAAAFGERGLPVRVDVSQEPDVERMVASVIAKWGALDIVCNVAGVMDENALITDLEVLQWERIIGINARGMFLSMKHALPHLVHRKGNVVNVASTAGVLAPGPGNAAYCASKAAILALTRTAALEFGLLGVRVNAVLPGVTLSPLAKLHLDEASLKSQADHSLLGRAAEPDEVAAAITFLCSKDASYITGVSLPVDGGALASYTSRGVGDALTPTDVGSFISRSSETSPYPFYTTRS